MSAISPRTAAGREHFPDKSVLLTLDRRDFADLLGTSSYGLAILKPGDFLQRERIAGKLAGRIGNSRGLRSRPSRGRHKQRGRT